ncbi:MAG TPA: bifunctional DNA-formamidopyrimidine glycosylase/DNA-(apurinic or apyrimidinic site) lyase [Methylocella sp.]|nr:bifunctional DNA-formamidopyrimidine glycosylase/DNA-(apurinic or apyrimidinic site) lyase [Methylocella sp.]
MPELPEVETVRRGLEPVMAGARLMAVEQRRADLRFPFPARFAERLTGRRIEALRRRAKYLIADLDGVELLVMHLGMSGSFRIEKPLEVGQTAPAPVGKNLLHDHVAFRLSTGPSIIYNDPRRFGFMQLIARTEFTEHPLFKDIGVEPLGSEFDGATLARLCSGRKAPLKSVLLDQRLIAGLGNIYVCEALHRAGLSPRRAAASLAHQDGSPGPRALRLADAIREVLEEAVAAGGSSLRDHRQADGALGYFQHHFRVYGRNDEPCPRCGTRVRRITQSGRATFYCGSCQR